MHYRTQSGIMMSVSIDENSLEHHGILGQKWGVRRFQNPDGSLTAEGKKRYSKETEAQTKSYDRKRELVKNKFGIDVQKSKIKALEDHSASSTLIKKGEKVYHVTPNDFRALNKDQDLYVSATTKDRNLYRSFLTLMLDKKGYGTDTPISEVSFKLKEDVKAPSNKTQQRIAESIGVTDYDDFIKNLDHPSELKSMFYKRLQKEGYNAVLDTHDIYDSWMQASKPLILINAFDTCGDMKVDAITDDDVLKSLKSLSLIS